MRPADEVLKYQKWVAEQLGGMLAAAPNLSLPPAREKVMKAVSACVEKVCGGNERAFIQQVSDINRSTLQDWLHGRTRPRLGSLMALCYRAGVPVKDFLITDGKFPSFSYSKIRGEKKEYTRKLDESELAQLKGMLELMLCENPPPSIKKVTSRTGFHPLTLKKYFPQICSAIAQRHTEYRKNLYDEKRLRAALTKAVAEEPPPPLNEVARRLGCSRGFLRNHFPEECRIIVARHDSRRREPYDRGKVEKSLREFLRLDFPISLTACSMLLGCSVGFLILRFPALSHRISERHSRHKCALLAERRKRNSSKIRRTVRALTAQGIKPTVSRLKKMLPGVPMYNRTVQAMIREECA
jgi:transcriptional regulator with XRE-family HTH domain